MQEPIIAVGASLGAVLALMLLFHIEHARGRRFFAFARDHFDYWLFKIAHAFLKFFRKTGRNTFRQIGRYLFHTILIGILAFLERTQKQVKNLMRTNKTLARRFERDRATRNKLEEIALHKMEVALSEEEKRRHKERSLHG